MGSCVSISLDKALLWFGSSVVHERPGLKVGYKQLDGINELATMGDRPIAVNASHESLVAHAIRQILLMRGHAAHAIAGHSLAFVIRSHHFSLPLKYRTSHRRHPRSVPASSALRRDPLPTDHGPA